MKTTSATVLKFLDELMNIFAIS